MRAWLGDDRGSSTRASPVLSGGSTLSVARDLVQTALPRESCSTLPLGPFGCRLKSGRRIFTVSTTPHAPMPQGIRYSSLKHGFWIVLQLGHRIAHCTISITQWAKSRALSGRHAGIYRQLSGKAVNQDRPRIDPAESTSVLGAMEIWGEMHIP